MAVLSAGAAAGRVGSSFYNSVGVVSEAIAIVTPASNVNGIYLRQWSIKAGTGVSLSLTAGTAAPTTTTSNNTIAQIPAATLQSSRDCFIPAGQGFYVFSNAAGPSTVFISYDLL